MTAESLHHEPTFRELYTPKLVTVLREGYGLDGLRADMIAGLTVAIVALPLSMAIAIASGVSPDRGLFTAIVGGFMVSLLGGSRFQIGGPAGAFIVLVLATVQAHGLDGLILATFMSGIFLTLVGYLRLGTYIKFIPYPVTVGFTAGIAVIIFASQLHELFGLTLNVAEPGELIPKIKVLLEAAPSFNAAAFGVALLTIAVILVLRQFRPHWPGLLIAVILASAAVYALGIPVETIGTRFGGI
ncbi:MAG: SulP family inorganic anion transporter, partial [Alphaproteobacteria bacterium]|nr:SulP family inorganic anion transporter [Alphaproteobacteria bacterium]